MSTFVGTIKRLVGSGVIAYYKTPVKRDFRYDLHVKIKNQTNIRTWFYWGSSDRVQVWEDLIDGLNKTKDSFRIIDTKTNQIMDINDLYK